MPRSHEYSSVLQQLRWHIFHLSWGLKNWWNWQHTTHWCLELIIHDLIWFDECFFGCCCCCCFAVVVVVVVVCGCVASLPELRSWENWSKRCLALSVKRALQTLFCYSVGSEAESNVFFFCISPGGFYLFIAFNLLTGLLVTAFPLGIEGSYLAFQATSTPHLWAKDNSHPFYIDTWRLLFFFCLVYIIIQHLWLWLLLWCLGLKNFENKSSLFLLTQLLLIIEVGHWNQ